MFGVFYFGEFYFGDSIPFESTPIPVPQTTSYDTLDLTCGLRRCSDVDAINNVSIFDLYSLQSATPPVSYQSSNCQTKTCTNQNDFAYSLQDGSDHDVIPAANCSRKSCATTTGVLFRSDIQIYNLQDALYFTENPLVVTPQCPIGAYCPPGTFPPITYPPDDFPVIPPPTIPVPDGPTGSGSEPIVLSIKGCKTTITRVLPATATQAQIQAAVNDMAAEAAKQQAVCDTFPNTPPGYIPVLLIGTITPDYGCMDKAFSATLPTNSLQLPIYAGISAGSLPPGITGATSGRNIVFTGTPTTPGTYIFQVTVTNDLNQLAVSMVTIKVVGITTTSPLPSGSVGSIYSTTLATTGFSGAVLWGIASGGLPDGLVINSATGEITGVPLTVETSDFIVFVQDSARQCLKSFSMNVSAASTADMQYFLAFGNADALDYATINAYDFTAGLPGDGTFIGSSITVDFKQKTVGAGFTIAFYGNLYINAGNAGTWRMQINNLIAIPNLGFSDPRIDVIYNGGVVHTFDLMTAVGVDFFDVVAVDGDVLQFLYAVDGGAAAIPAPYHTVMTPIKL